MTELHISQDLSLSTNIALIASKDDAGITLRTSITDESFISAVTAALTTLGVKVAPLSVTKILNPIDSSKLVLVVGASTADGAEQYREAAGAAVRASTGLNSLTLAFDVDGDNIGAVYEGAALGAYAFNAYKEVKETPAASVDIYAQSQVSEEIISRAQAIAEATNRVRDLVNITPNYLTPVSFAELAKEEAEAAGVSVKIYDEKELEVEKLNGLLQVGRGSASAPRMVRLEWNPEGAQGFTALVGKGITFDSGGYSLKPSTSMVEMKTDMTGAATIMQAIIVAAKLGFKRRVVAWMCLAENLVSGTAGRPDDVFTYRNGISVEVNNTDAEGRLVMADGLIMGVEEQPDEIIDIATLTGAQMVALGNRVTGIMGTDAVRDGLVAASTAVGESAWAMPLPADLRSSLDSDIADMKNSGSRHGGMLVAGLFLKEFVGETPWAHIDIAGPSFNREAAYGYTPKGGTGVMLRTLVNYLDR